ncbi:hypothetical protein [Limnochorda pilosa]|uniref:Uncharacterized protein n=1 Tax=Limnochorda pilosa TaxID=1555112 RepID=A0A0K2SMB8_LIMPI|nr:hypothetical protein [Limnochorda pilosa]BAS28261.1 hypothetical protein LIP_2420 [Limnochorda pilosa]
MLAVYLTIDATNRQPSSFRKARLANEKGAELARILGDRFPEAHVLFNGTRFVRGWVEARHAPETLVGLLEYLVDAWGLGRFAVGLALGPIPSVPDTGTWLQRLSEPALQSMRACGLARDARVPLETAESGTEADPGVSAGLNLLLWLRSRWPAETRTVIERAERASTLRALAEELGISPPALTQRLGRAGWRPYRHARRRLIQQLERAVRRKRSRAGP